MQVGDLRVGDLVEWDYVKTPKARGLAVVTRINEYSLDVNWISMNTELSQWMRYHDEKWRNCGWRLDFWKLVARPNEK